MNNFINKFSVARPILTACVARINSEWHKTGNFMSVIQFGEKRLSCPEPQNKAKVQIILQVTKPLKSFNLDTYSLTLSLTLTQISGE